MRKSSSRFILFVCLFFVNTVSNVLALGLDFIERASFNKDGSGKFSIKVDLTKTKKLVSIVQYLNKDYEDFPYRVGYNALCCAQEKLKKVPDIGHVHVKHNQTMLKFTLSFVFKNLPALNNAMHAINEGLDPPSITYFSLNDNLFVREDMNGIAKKLIFYQQHSNCLIKSLNLAAFFKTTTYTTVYNFYNKIESYSNPFSELTADKKTIRIRHHVFAADETEESIGNRVHLAKET